MLIKVNPFIMAVSLAGFTSLLTLFWLSGRGGSSLTEIRSPPHIIFIYADDLGWNDVSFHGSPEIPTPNIDALALNGITLNNYYGEMVCTPSRAALLSGLHPIRLGLQHFVIKAGEETALPLNVTTLPQHLRRLGYATHMIGKWHLGYQTKQYTPTYRGFDSFFGYLNGAIDYYDYTHFGSTELPRKPRYYGIDLYDGDRVIKDFRGKYVTHVFTEKAENVIQQHNASKPLFLYLSHLAVHSGTEIQKLQAPPEIIKKFKYIKDINRRTQAAVTSALDDSVGAVFKALHEKNMLWNSIIMFVSDNGGQTAESKVGYGSNFPLRGKKLTLWEGGIRLPAVIWSPLLNLQQQRVSHQLMHAIDWLPTLYEAAGGNPNDLGELDGLSIWKALTKNSLSPRKKLLHNVDPIDGVSALRMGDMKVINGSTDYTSWYGPTGLENIAEPSSMEKWIFANGSSVRDILLNSGMWIAKNPDGWYKEAKITCNKPLPEYARNCDPNVKPCLFNITADPCEYVNLADLYPNIVESMMSVIFDYKKVSMKPQSKPSHPLADPMCHNFTYVPWLDPEYLTACDYTS